MTLRVQLGFSWLGHRKISGGAFLHGEEVNSVEFVSKGLKSHIQVQIPSDWSYNNSDNLYFILAKPDGSTSATQNISILAEIINTLSLKVILIDAKMKPIVKEVHVTKPTKWEENIRYVLCVGINSGVIQANIRKEEIDADQLNEMRAELFNLVKDEIKKRVDRRVEGLRLELTQSKVPFEQHEFDLEGEIKKAIQNIASNKLEPALLTIKDRLNRTDYKKTNLCIRGTSKKLEFTRMDKYLNLGPHFNEVMNCYNRIIIPVENINTKS